MKLKHLLLSVILLCLCSIQSFAADGAVITWLGGGWLVKVTYTNPAPIAGNLSIAATVQTEVDGVLQTTTVQEALTLPVPVTVARKIWTTTANLKNTYNIAEVSGDGTAVYDAAGKLVFAVRAPNDGLPHTVQFKLMIITP